MSDGPSTHGGKGMMGSRHDPTVIPPTEGTTVWITYPITPYWCRAGGGGIQSLRLRGVCETRRPWGSWLGECSSHNPQGPGVSHTPELLGSWLPPSLEPWSFTVGMV